MPKVPLSPKKKHNRQSRRQETGTVSCLDCGKQGIKRRGLASHYRSCTAYQLRISAAQHTQERNADNDMLVDTELEHVQAPSDGDRSPPDVVGQLVPEHPVRPNNATDTTGAQERLPSVSRKSEDDEDIHMADHSVLESESNAEDNSEMSASLVSASESGRWASDEHEEDDSDVQGSAAESELELLDEWMSGNAAADSVSMHGNRTVDSEPAAPPLVNTNQPSVDVSSMRFNHNDIHIEYHPRSQRPAEDYEFYDYEPFRVVNLDDLSSPEELTDTSPWAPFSSLLDYEIADFVLESALTKPQTDKLLSLIRKCISAPGEFTLRSSTDLRSLWDAAKVVHQTTKFVKSTITIPYPKKTSETVVEFDVWTQSLWDWCDELLSNPSLAPNFHWDAERVFKYNAKTDEFERCISEPWTADAFWDAQSRIPKDGYQFSIILYADKTQLSSFGTAKAYPVVARCGNLPVELRNGTGLAGGRLVGWLPIVQEDAGETRKKNFINLKRVVWHESFKVILESIIKYSKTGFLKMCGDGIVRRIFPIVLILSADYEEQCFMATIRGLRSQHPCPVCLVSEDDLADLTVQSPRRTSEAMSAVYDKAQSYAENPALKNKEAAKEKLLKSYGLRDVENVFWSLSYTDVYSALSWDRLHAYHGGLFSRHLWDLFKKNLEELGKQAGKQIDQQVDRIPRWSGLHHFKSIIKTGEYTDGRKYEDMSKVLVFASHNILTHEATIWGYRLLQLIRAYLELDMYASLLIHTSETIKLGKEELLEFHRILEEFKTEYPEKKWNFPKAHTHIHMFDDITSKGATRNYNSKPNENAHCPLKVFYFQTNFKKIEEQILRIHQDHLVSAMISAKIDAFERRAEAIKAANSESTFQQSEVEHVNANVANDARGEPLQPGNNNLSAAVTDSAPVIAHVILGSRLEPTTIASIENDFSLPPQPPSPSVHQRSQHPLTAPSVAELPPDFSLAFYALRKKIAAALSSILTSERGQHTRAVVHADEKITPYQYAKVYYESVTSWERQVDHVRVNPKFHGRDRHDYVLLQTHEDGFCFAQMIYMFEITHTERHKAPRTHALALVLPFDAPVHSSALQRTRDRDLRFIRVRARPKKEAVVVSIYSIVRGALLVEDYGGDPGVRIVVDVTDSDIWWRMKSLNLRRNIKFS